jgi:hypothetical protein
MKNANKKTGNDECDCVKHHIDMAINAIKGVKA